MSDKKRHNICYIMLDAEEAGRYDKTFPNKANETAKIVFDHMQFGYTDKLLMKDFNMEVKDGQMVAIVGHTGAGKTTLINFAERPYELCCCAPVINDLQCPQNFGYG